MSAKTAIVTGASYGIGQGIAYALARKGYDILITHLDEEVYYGHNLAGRRRSYSSRNA